MTFLEDLRSAPDIYALRPYLGPEYEGEMDGYTSCPCFTIDVPGFRAEGHCWRVGHDDHDYTARKSDGRCCVHVWGTKEDGELLRTLLDDAKWYGGWALGIET